MSHYPDAVATITIYPASKESEKPRCFVREIRAPLQFDQDTVFHDAVLSFDEIGELHAGKDFSNISVSFLYPEDVIPKIKTGSKFKLWSGTFFGEGTITGLNLGM